MVGEDAQDPRRTLNDLHTPTIVASTVGCPRRVDDEVIARHLF
jgi:hypothetical protein